ncbi:GAF domain-containing protein, partial [Leptolyngbya sp. FACHB-36]|uniref:GAF domain-containing protein n=1 Tax=Leptolyngbya sp. FACHB-36 TaxID=2692808 RepID=UPI001680A47B
MVEPIQQHHEPIADLQAQLAVLKQENLELKSRLQSCESQAKLQLDDRTSTREHRLLEATAEVANALLTIAHLDEAVNTALQIIGEALDTDRVNVIENFAHPTDASLYWRVLYEWDSPGTMPQFSDSKAAQGRYDEIPWLYELFQQSRTPSYRIEDVPEPFRSEQRAIGVKSTHLVAIQVEDKWWGVLGLDDCREAKRRSAAEMAVLRIVADSIGSAIQRQRTQQAKLDAEQARSRMAAERSAELQQTLDRLAESEHHYRTLFELSNEGIYRFEFEPPVPTSLPIDEQLDLALQHYRYVEANETFCAQMGLSIDQLREFTLSDFHGDLAANRQVNRSILANGYQIRNAETDELDALGRRKYFLNNIVCDVRDGYLWGGWCTQTDITELRETQEALLKNEQARSAELEKSNEALRHRDRLLSVVAQITKDLLEAEDVDTAILSALQAVGEAANMSRVLLILEHQEPKTHRLKHCVTHEWAAATISDHHAAGMAVMDNENFQVLIQPLHRGQSLWRIIEDLPDVTRSQFEKLEIKSTGVVPIFIEGRYVGCVGFDDCVAPRHWSQQEIDVLTAAAESIGAALHRKQLVDRLIAERIQAEQARSAEL